MAGASDIFKATIRRMANTLGYDIVAFDADNIRWRLARLLSQHHIAVVLDVGANSGAFGWDMRELGFAGRIVSFEPLAEAFNALKRAIAGDAAWQAVPIALGDRDEDRIIHVAANSQSSSFLSMLGAHTDAAPESIYRGQEKVAVRRLDGILGAYCRPDEPTFLKIDTQGFEKQVLDGARGILMQVALLQLECSLVPLYDGAMLIEETIGHARALGYDPVDIAPTFRHRDRADLMQVDMLFVQREK